MTDQHHASLRPADGLDLSGVRATFDDIVDNPLWKTQKPYKNGVVVHTRSIWGGNGFGTDTCKVAVRDGEVVGVYESSGHTHQAARVVDIPLSIGADIAWTGHGTTRRSYVTRTALSKWTEAIKAL